MSEREPIGVVGAGWVGLVTAACFAELGHPVVVREILPEKLEALRRGELPIYEPGLDELVEKNAGRLTFTGDMDELISAARLVFVCVQTPPTYSGDADLSAVTRAVEEIGDGEGRALVMKSTVPVGTGRTIRRQAPGLAYVSCPEFLREGTAVRDFLEPDRVVIGAEPGDEWAADAVAAAYEDLGAPIVRTDVSSAEMIKLASNAFLATKISFINEIANVCDETGADVTEVARGMGLDDRIGGKFLQAGIGYGGSCFHPCETVLVRHDGWTKLVSLECLWELIGGDDVAEDGEAIAPLDLEVWSWVPGEAEPEWMPVAAMTCREYEGRMIEVATKMGRRVRVTEDHPFFIGDGEDDDVLTRVLASELETGDWVPIANGSPASFRVERYPVLGAIDDGYVDADQVLVRPNQSEVQALADVPPAQRTALLDHHAPASRMGDIKRSGTLRLREAALSGMHLRGARFATVGNGVFGPADLELDDRFWRVVGLYLAEGCTSTERTDSMTRVRIIWSFHPENEQHLVDEVRAYWHSQGIEVNDYRTATAHRVEVSSRIIGSWWLHQLGLGANSYEQRVPGLIWEQGPEAKRALLSGLWEGDGSWSLVNQGPSVILEWGTISDELADGVARLLGDLGFVCSWRRGRTRKSTKDTHWLRLSGADQIERALFLVPSRDRVGVVAALSRQKKRIAPTGYRRFTGNMAWARVVKTTSTNYTGRVYSLRVPGSQTVVTTGGLVCAQCFPKDVSALKMLAGNIGYHFQLLGSVIEVNELQKRRVVAKLTKHLGSLEGKRVALLGLAFKPDTDDMREASSLVLAARLQGEGAQVVAFDPVAHERASELLPGVEMAGSALDALEGADAAVVVTEWPEFAELDWSDVQRRMAHPLVVDGRNFLDAEAVSAAGVAYEGIGRRAQAAKAAEGGERKARA